MILTIPFGESGAWCGGGSPSSGVAGWSLVAHQ